MDPWKRYRLLACIAVIVAILGAGIYGHFNAPPPEIVDWSFGRPYPDPKPPRNANPFVTLHIYYHCKAKIDGYLEEMEPKERASYRGAKWDIHGIEVQL
jgi:hypothetical protein